MKTLWDDGNQFSQFTTQFQWLLDSPGIGMLTGEAGVGKTAALRHIAKDINPHRYQLIYMSETDFGRVDLYRHLALALGLETSFRRAQLWRDIKARVTELFDGKNLMPVWLIDEAQNLPKEFFRRSSFISKFCLRFKKYYDYLVYRSASTGTINRQGTICRAR